MAANIKIGVEADFAAAQKELDNLANSVKEAGDSGEEASKGFDIAGLSLTDLNQGMELVQKAAGMMGEVFNATVGEVLKYSDQVRELSRASGASAEDTSRLIQVADDLQVEYGTLEQAAKSLAKNGIALTTDELAKASDEYLSFSDAGDRAEFAVKKFGRSGMELTKILEQGGAALREMAAGQDKNLIMTEKQVQAARDLEIAQDNLNDSVMGLQLAIGNFLIPVLNDAASAVEKYVNWGDKMNAILQQHSQELAKTGTSFDDYATEMIRAWLVSKNLGSTTADVGDVLLRFGGDADKAMKAIGGMSKAELEAAQAANKLEIDTKAAADAVQQIQPELLNLQLALENEAGAYTDTGTAAQGYLDTLFMTGQAVDGLVSKYGALSQAQIYNQLATGMSKEAAIQLGIAMGVLSPAVMAARDAIDSLNSKYPPGTRDSEAYKNQAEALAAAIAKLQDKTIHITTYYDNFGNPNPNTENPNNPNGPGQYGGPPPVDHTPYFRGGSFTRGEWAGGGSMDIGGGYSQDSFPLGNNQFAQTGERVTVQTRGDVNSTDNLLQQILNALQNNRLTANDIARATRDMWMQGAQ